MEDQNRKLLKEVTKKCLEKAMEAGLDTEEGQNLFEVAMTGYDRDAKMTEIDVQNELKAKDSKRDFIIKCVELGSVVVLTPIVEYVTKIGFAEFICTFEKDFSFMTTPGRSLSSLFRFKK